MKRVLLTLAICAFVAAPAFAGMTVNWATGGAQITKVGNTDFPTLDWDIVTLSPLNGSLTLVPGTPVEVEINPLTFEAGPSSYGFPIDSFIMTRDITVNGVMKSLSNPMTAYISYSDTLFVYNGDPVTFGNIIVTPLGWVLGL
jgi:hypothetical protein